MKKTKKIEAENPKLEASSTPPSAISDAEVQACLDHLKAIRDVLAPYATPLTAAQRKSATRLRKGGDKIIPLLSRLATKVGVAGAALDVDAMQTHVDLANALLPVLTSAKTLADLLADAVLSSNGQAWRAATTLHGVLKRVTRDMPEVRRDMEVVSAAFALRPRAPKPDAAPKAEPDTAPPGAEPQQAPTA